MESRPEDLADYRKPPIDEVVISVQFPAIEGCSSERLREFWTLVRKDYPFLEGKDRLEIPLEQPGPIDPTNIQLKIQLPSPFGSSRLWLVSETDDFLIQVQDSTFIQNWRRRGSEYPRFEKVRDLFWSNFARFRDYLTKAGLPLPSVQQIEVSYVNWISGTIVEFLRPASETAVDVARATHEPDIQTWSARYTILDDSNTVQRLHAQASPAVRSREPTQLGTQFTLTFRATRANGFEDTEAAEIIDASRVVIVQAFTGLTTPAAHRVWERFR